MRTATLHSTKHDGSLHYKFPTQLVHESDDLVVMYRGPGVTMESYRGTWASDSHLLAFFWLNDHYHNADVMWDGDFVPRCHYVNIATPARWDGQSIGYDDLDLDLILRHGEDRIILDDEDEFEEHQVKWNYPTKLIDRCWAEVEHVRGLMEQRVWPFVDELYDWRPGQPITLPV
jgi:protein associated with RNAse G/E